MLLTRDSDRSNRKTVYLRFIQNRSNSGIGSGCPCGRMLLLIARWQALDQIVRDTGSRLCLARLSIEQNRFSALRAAVDTDVIVIHRNAEELQSFMLTT